MDLKDTVVFLKFLLFCFIILQTPCLCTNIIVKYVISIFDIPEHNCAQNPYGMPQNYYIRGR